MFFQKKWAKNQDFLKVEELILFYIYSTQNFMLIAELPQVTLYEHNFLYNLLLLNYY